MWLIDPDAGTIEVRTRGGVIVRGPDDEAASGLVTELRLTGRSLLG